MAHAPPPVFTSAHGDTELPSDPSAGSRGGKNGHARAVARVTAAGAERSRTQRGVIINTASIAGFEGQPGPPRRRPVVSRAVNANQIILAAEVTVDAPDFDADVVVAALAAVGGP